MGRAFLVAAFALVLGTLLGAFQPRGELIELRTRMLQLEQKTRDCQRGAAGAGLREFFRAPPARDPSGGDPPPAGEAAAPKSTEAPVTPGADTGQPAASGTPPAPSGDGEIGALVDAMDARAAQARAALLEQGDLDDETIAAVDDAIDRMNARLKQQVDAFAASVEAGGEPDRREMMEFAAEALDAVIEADDVIVANIPADVREQMDDEALDPMSFISGDTLAAIARLEGR
jgi:hypothetical protein